MNEELKKQKYQFGEDFTDAVMSRIREERPKSMSTLIRRWQPVIAWSAAACLVLIIGAVYLMNGSVSADAFIGLSDYSEIELTELLAGN